MLFQRQRVLFTSRYRNRVAKVTKFLCNAGFVAIGMMVLLKADFIISAFSKH